MKLISFCLYGSAPRYLDGMLANARLAPTIFPGWQVRCYIEAGLPTAALEKENVQIVQMSKSLGASGMFWRLLAAWDTPEAERAIFRDADSRLNTKEAAAVAEWEASGRAAHCMYDHPYHTMPLMGGAWGVKCGRFPQAVKDAILTACSRPAQYMDDQTFLAATVWPLVAHDTLAHSSVPLPWHKPFPKHPPIEGFVSQVYGDNGKPVYPKVEA